LFELVCDSDVIGAVAGEPIAFVDDDVVYAVAFFREVAHHVFEGGAVGGGAGDTALDELLNYHRAHGLGLLFVGGALGGDREAFFAAASGGLLTCGNAQVYYSALGR